MINEIQPKNSKILSNAPLKKVKKPRSDGMKNTQHWTPLSIFLAGIKEIFTTNVNHVPMITLTVSNPRTSCYCSYLVNFCQGY